jgi:GMC oxidoreductase
VQLAPNDPSAPALIDPNYLAEPADLDLLIEGVALSRETGKAAAFADWRAQEVYPGPNAAIADCRDFILRAANSFHHPVGTCRMGEVVDEALRVRGVSGLRIIDASVLPGIPVRDDQRRHYRCRRESQRCRTRPKAKVYDKLIHRARRAPGCARQNRYQEAAFGRSWILGLREANSQ